MSATATYRFKACRPPSVRLPSPILLDPSLIKHMHPVPTPIKAGNDSGDLIHLAAIKREIRRLQCLEEQALRMICSVQSFGEANEDSSSWLDRHSEAVVGFISSSVSSSDTCPSGGITDAFAQFSNEDSIAEGNSLLASSESHPDPCHRVRCSPYSSSALEAPLKLYHLSLHHSAYNGKASKGVHPSELPLLHRIRQIRIERDLEKTFAECQGSGKPNQKRGAWVDICKGLAKETSVADMIERLEHEKRVGAPKARSPPQCASHDANTKGALIKTRKKNEKAKTECRSRDIKLERPVQAGLVNGVGNWMDMPFTNPCKTLSLPILADVLIAPAAYALGCNETAIVKAPNLNMGAEKLPDEAMLRCEMVAELVTKREEKKESDLAGSDSKAASLSNPGHQTGKLGRPLSVRSKKKKKNEMEVKYAQVTEDFSTIISV
jgi:hypothetical protein